MKDPAQRKFRGKEIRAGWKNFWLSRSEWGQGPARLENCEEKNNWESTNDVCQVHFRPTLAHINFDTFQVVASGAAFWQAVGTLLWLQRRPDWGGPQTAVVGDRVQSILKL